MDPFKAYEPRSKLGMPPKLSREDAEIVAIRAIAFISADDALLSRFISLTGCSLDELKERVHDLQFLGAVLDFMLADEAAVMAFSEESGLHPEVAALARLKLP